MNALYKMPGLMLAVVMSIAAWPVFADSLDGLEMDVIASDEAPEAMMRRIELPEAARSRRPIGGDAINGTANEARDRGASFGQETAEQARERRGPPAGFGPPAGPPENRPPAGDDRPEAMDRPQAERPQSDDTAGNRPQVLPRP